MVTIDTAETPSERRLAEFAKALSHPVRVRLLFMLQSPRTLSEIEVTKPGDDREKPLARQTVKRHLEELMACDIVVAREAQRKYGPTTEYLVNNQRLFALSEQLRALARLRPADDPQQETLESKPSLETLDPSGPHLVLVKGVREGQVFELGGGRDRWVVGRRRDADVALDFDPYVSADNTVIEREGTRFTVADLPESRNGTVLNGESLPGGEPRELAVGDILRVGRSTLTFRR